MTIYTLGPDYTPDLPPEGQYWVAPSATLIGRVRLEKNASIWWGVTLRGDNDWLIVGEDSNVQDNSVLHTDPGLPLTIGKGVTIGHLVMLHGCTIGDGSLIGIGSTVLNRAIILFNSIVGANSLVTEGKTFPEGHLIIGSPARAVRPLRPEEIEGRKRSATGYVNNWKRYAEAMKPL